MNLGSLVNGNGTKAGQIVITLSVLVTLGTIIGGAFWYDDRQQARADEAKEEAVEESRQDIASIADSINTRLDTQRQTIQEIMREIRAIRVRLDALYSQGVGGGDSAHPQSATTPPASIEK